MSFDIHSYTAKIHELLSQGRAFVVVTLVGMRGSAPQVLGAKAIVTEEGIVFGTVGGGKVESRAIQHAQELLTDAGGKSCELLTWNLQTDIKMTCGGEVQFYFEVILGNDWQVAVFGAGHIAQALVPILLTLNCQITWIDQREEWLDRITPHPRLKKICCDDLRSVVKTLHPSTFFVLMTQGHATDLPVLAEVLASREAPYVGVLGSLQKAKILKRELTEMGLPTDRIESYSCPMGMPIGNNTPPEIAISVLSQLIQKRDASGLFDQKTKKF